MISEALDKKLRDNIKDIRNSMFTGDGMSVSQIRWVWFFDQLIYLNTLVLVDLC